MRRALLVIDVQNDVIGNAAGAAQVVDNVRTLVGHCREHGVPVVWVQHNDPWLPRDSEGWQIVSSLQPAPGEARVDKQYRSSFEQTDLQALLAQRQELIVCGAETNYCIRHTVHAALERGFSITLVGDAHTCSGPDALAVIAEQNANLASYELPGRRCRTLTTAEVLAVV